MGWSWQDKEVEDGMLHFLIQIYPKGHAESAPKRVMFRMMRSEGIDSLILVKLTLHVEAYDRFQVLGSSLLEDPGTQHFVRLQSRYCI